MDKMQEIILMRLKRITFNHFRCFDHLELDLHPRLTVLVGKNGGGKTAVLDGIALGLSPICGCCLQRTND